MTELVTRIKERGYWRLLIRPDVKRADRIVIGAGLVEQIRSVSVQLRGWDYPHVDFNSRPLIEMDSIGQDTEWQYFYELWRVFRSGQFLHLAGMRHDWGAGVELGVGERVPENARILGIGDTVFRFTEMMFFASGYLAKLLDGESAAVGIEVGNLSGRHLVVDDPGRGSWFVEHVATTKEPYVAQLALRAGAGRPELLRQARELAQGLYRLFGTEVNGTVLEDWQGKVGRW